MEFCADWEARENFFGLALAVTILGPDMSTDRRPMGGKKYLKKKSIDVSGDSVTGVQAPTVGCCKTDKNVNIFDPWSLEARGINSLLQ